MATAHDVAAAIIERVGPIDQLKLHKLLYYAQGWSVAWRGEPLFSGRLQAWRFGPVEPGVYHTYSDYGEQEISEARGGDPHRLSQDERHTLAAVLGQYGDLKGTRLSTMTHEDDAWRKAWGRRSAADRGTQVIEPEEIARSLRRSVPQPALGVAPTAQDDLLEAAARGDGDAFTKLLLDRL